MNRLHVILKMKLDKSGKYTTTDAPVFVLEKLNKKLVNVKNIGIFD